MVSRRIKDAIDKLLKGLNHSSPGLCLQLSSLTLANQIKHIKFGLVDCVGNLFHRADVCDSIAGPD